MRTFVQKMLSNVCERVLRFDLETLYIIYLLENTRKSFHQFITCYVFGVRLREMCSFTAGLFVYGSKYSLPGRG